MQAVEPLVFTVYGKDGRMLLRKHGLCAGKSFNIPRHLRKRIARTETIDARGHVVDSWEAPWETSS